MSFLYHLVFLLSFPTLVTPSSLQNREVQSQPGDHTTSRLPATIVPAPPEPDRPRQLQFSSTLYSGATPSAPTTSPLPTHTKCLPAKPTPRAHHHQQLRLLAEAHASSRVLAHLAGIVLRERLGYNNTRVFTKHRPAANATFDVFGYVAGGGSEAIGHGVFDAALEVSPLFLGASMAYDVGNVYSSGGQEMSVPVAISWWQATLESIGGTIGADHYPLPMFPKKIFDDFRGRERRLRGRPLGDDPPSPIIATSDVAIIGEGGSSRREEVLPASGGMPLPHSPLRNENLRHDENNVRELQGGATAKFRPHLFSPLNRAEHPFINQWSETIFDYPGLHSVLSDVKVPELYGAHGRRVIRALMDHLAFARTDTLVFPESQSRIWRSSGCRKQAEEVRGALRAVKKSGMK